MGTLERGSVQALVGVGVKINFSQLGRALTETGQYLEDLGSLILSKIQEKVADIDVPGGTSSIIQK